MGLFDKMKNIIYILFFSLFLVSCTSSKYASTRPVRENKISNSDKASPKAKDILKFANKLKGSPYKYAGTTPKGFDCSGFVQYVYKNFNYSLPRTSDAQSNVGKNVKKNQLKPGDLVFFKGRNSNSSQVGHVGIVVESYKSGRFKFIHASTNRGVTESFSDETYWNIRYLKGRRILSD